MTVPVFPPIGPVRAHVRQGKAERALHGAPIAHIQDSVGHPFHDSEGDLGSEERRSGVATALARAVYTGRRRRARFLSPDLFGEPTWDILLDLYVAERENRRVPTTSACIGAHVPPTTALRWLRILEARGMVMREDDGRDGRRTFVRLTARGMAAMDALLDNLATTLAIALGHPDQRRDSAR